MKNKVLVTGGAGFIGSHLVKLLVDKGYKSGYESGYESVAVLDNFSVGRLKNLQGLGLDRVDNVIKVVNGDVCNPDLVRELVFKEHIDIIYHLAVRCLVECNEDIGIAHDVNVGGTFNVCKAAYEIGRDTGRDIKIVYVSSSEVYGTSKLGESGLLMNEEHPTEPQSIYGLSKLMGEEYVRFFNKYYGVPAVIIRPFNAYGVNHRVDAYAAVITAFIKRLENGEYPIIEGTGEQSRDFTYVTDTVEGIELLGSKLERGEIVNIGSGSAVSINDLATMLLKIYGKEKDVLCYKEPRPNDVFKLEADISLAKSYGYRCKVGLEEGLMKYIDWYNKEIRRDNV